MTMTTTTTTRPAAKFCFLCFLDEVFVFLFSSGRRMVDDGSAMLSLPLS
jgi:hypothetical protein